MCQKQTFDARPCDVSDFSTARLLPVRFNLCNADWNALFLSFANTRGRRSCSSSQPGDACDKPVTAKRDVRLSRPDLAVWVLDCRSATYRVRLHPNMAAYVIKLKHHH